MPLSTSHAPTPLVTAVMTAFDDAAFVDRAVASALGQRGLPEHAIEIVVSDDGSTDGTIELLEAMGPPVRVLRQQQLGPSVGMHRAIAAARGRYVSMLDADDEWKPNKLARALEIFERRPEVGLVYGDTEHVDADGRTIAPSHFAVNGLVPPVGRVLGRFIECNYAGTTSITLPTEVARSIPATPDWAWCRDWWVATMVAQTHELDVVDDPVTRYRLHGSNLSSHDAARPEKTLGLIERDLRVRRIFMRSLDLADTSLDELATAWKRHVHHVGVLDAHGRGPAATILPVSADDRAEAVDALREARALLGADPVAAGHAAFKALGADPFSADAQELFERAREWAAATPAAPRPRASIARADRLRELAERRAAVPAAIALPDRLRAYQRMETLRRMLAGSGTPAAELHESSEAQREQALEAVATGIGAARAGRHDEAALALAAAVAYAPGDEHARLALDEAIATLSGRPLRRGSDDARARLHPAPLGELDGARTFVALAFADELAADPALLATWTGAFGPDDDVTLVIYAPGADEASVADALAPALAAAGVGDDDERDFALVIGAPTPDREAGLARGASVLLTRTIAPAPFAALPVSDDTDDLRSLAERRLGFDGLGRPATVAVKLCARRWDEAGRAADLPVATAVAAEIERRGHRAVIQVAEEWDGAEARACDVALHLRGAWPYVPAPGQPTVAWDLEPSTYAITPGEAARFAAVVSGGDVPAAIDAVLGALRAPVAALAAG